MKIIDIQHVRVRFGSDPVLSDLSAEILAGEKVGLIGANGVGKSTLARLIVGTQEADAGTVHRGASATEIAYVPQHFPEDAGGSAEEFLIGDIIEMRHSLEEMEGAMTVLTGAPLDAMLRAYGDLRMRFEHAGGDDAESRASASLQIAGLSAIAGTQVQHLSGGEKNRLQILRGIVGRPDLLVLDEPGNHLDAWGLDWLEELLRTYPGAVLIISHNRYLLDRVVTRIIELRDGLATSWPGNYSAYRSARLRDAVRQAQDARADQKHLDRLEEMVNKLAQLARVRADPGIGQRLRARRTQLKRARNEAREAPEISEEQATVRLSRDQSKADIALEIRGYSRKVGDEKPQELFRGANALIHTGERVALVGPNGCGKTTLLKEIIASGSWDNDILRVGPSLTIGYCSQQAETFDMSLTIAENFYKAGARNRGDLFTLLSRYLFAYEELDRPLTTLSGGELNRLQLARTELIGANFLILDEPTNHMDIPGREVVEEALVDFPGTVLVVSHDRYLLDEVATRVVAVENGSLQSYPGTFSEYWFSTGRDAGAVVTAAANNSSARSSAGRPGAGPPADAPQRTARGLPPVESRLLEMEAEKIAVERRLASAYESGDLKLAGRLSKQLANLTRIYDDLYERWGE